MMDITEKDARRDRSDCSASKTYLHVAETERNEEHLRGNPEIYGLQDVLIDKSNIRLTNRIGQGTHILVHVHPCMKITMNM